AAKRQDGSLPCVFGRKLFVFLQALEKGRFLYAVLFHSKEADVLRLESAELEDVVLLEPMIKTPAHELSVVPGNLTINKERVIKPVFKSFKLSQTVAALGRNVFSDVNDAFKALHPIEAAAGGIGVLAALDVVLDFGWNGDRLFLVAKEVGFDHALFAK